MTTLLLEELGYPNIIIPAELLERAIKLCNNFANGEKEKRVVLQKFLNAAQDQTKTPDERDRYLQYAKLFFMLVSGIQCNIASDNINVIEISAIELYLKGCQEDEMQSNQIGAVFELIKQQETIGIDFLATFLFLLTIYYNELQKQKRNEQELEELCIELLKILDSLVLPEADLAAIYTVCYNSLSSSGGDAVQTYYHFNMNYAKNLLKCYQNIINKYTKLVNLIKDNNSLSQQYKESVLRDIETIPASLVAAVERSNAVILNALSEEEISFCDCCTLNLDNYKVYTFGLFYEFAGWYKQLTKKLAAVKLRLPKQQDLLSAQQLTEDNVVGSDLDEQQLIQADLQVAELGLLTEAIDSNLAELDMLSQEADQYIAAAKNATAQHRMKHGIVASNTITVVMAELEEKYNFSVTQEHLIMRLKSLNLKHLTCLAQVFEFKKYNKLTFKAVNDAVVALGGRFKNFDGSKTQILFPGGYSTASLCKNIKYKLCGGFHKRHNSCDYELLEYIHADLIKKALQRAGGIKIGETIKGSIAQLQTSSAGQDKRRAAKQGENIAKYRKNHVKTEERNVGRPWGNTSNISGENVAIQGEDADIQGEDAAVQIEHPTEGENVFVQGKNAALPSEYADKQGENTSAQGKNAAKIQVENVAIQWEHVSTAEHAALPSEYADTQWENTSAQGKNAVKIQGENLAIQWEHVGTLEENVSTRSVIAPQKTKYLAR